MDRKSHRYRTAIHEAGHAVIARVLGIGCKYVILRQDGDSTGHEIIPDLNEIYRDWERAGIHHRGNRSACRARIIVFMAGAEAERACLGAAGVADAPDRHQIDLMLESCLAESAYARRVAARLRAAARQLVRRHRPAIAHVAALLRAQRRLTQNRLDRAIRGARRWRKLGRLRISCGSS